MKLFEHWQQIYRRNRYMEFLSPRDLETRTCDILSNMSTLSSKGQISLHGLNDVERFWMMLWTHQLEEFNLRYGPYPNGFTNGFIRRSPAVKASYPDPPKAKLAIDKVGGIPKGCLFKFGKKEYLRDMFRYGKIRIAPASYYKDPSLNAAIQDDELSVTIEARSDQVTIKNVNGEDIRPVGNVKFRFESLTNCYVYCFSANYTFREFDDFDADTCIIIKEPGILLDRMTQAVLSKMPDYAGFSKSIHYIDPLQYNKKNVDIHFSKHFRHWYQNEYRIIWLPPEPIMQLDPLHIEIGAIEEYAEIIHI